MRPFFSSGRIDMIQSAFDRFTRILSSGAVYEALICIIEKNGAIFAILLHHFWMKISKKIEKIAISRKVGPFFILWLHGPHDRIFQRLWAQWTHPQLGGAYNTFHIHKWRHFSSNCLDFLLFFCLKLSNHNEKMAPFRLYWFKWQLNMLGGKTHVSATFADIFSGLNLVNGLMAPFFRCTFVLKKSIF